METNDEYSCRLCFLEKPEMLDVFGTTFSGLGIAQTIEKYFEHEDDETDLLPTVVCKDCWKQIESFHLFREQVVSARQNYLSKRCSIDIKTENPYCDGSIENIYTKSESVEEDEKLLLEAPNHDDNSPTKAFSEVWLKPLPNDDFDESNRNQNETNPIHAETDAQENQTTTSHVGTVRVVSHFDFQKSVQPKNISDLSPVQIQQIEDQYADMTCDVTGCGTTFKSIVEALDHYKHKHYVQNGYVKCCGKKFHDKRSYNDHIVCHVNPDLFKCPICGSISKNRKAYNAHKHSHKVKALRRFLCDICDKHFSIKLKLFDHIMNVHAAKKRHQCEHCKACFGYSRELKAHVSVKHSPYPDGYDCQDIEANLDQEQVQEFVLANFDRRCDACDYQSASLDDARSHYSECHGILDGFLRCCGRTFESPTTIAEHVSWHYDPSIFQCRQCKAQLKSKQGLKKHVRSHLAFRSQFAYPCDKCDKSFRRKIEFNAHLKKCRPRRCFRCESCDKRFLKREDLHEHVKVIHEVEIEEKRKKQQEKDLLAKYFDLSCDKCEAVFDSLLEAITHYQNVHDDPNGYIKCCNIKFQDANLVKDHVQFHENPEIFKCYTCGRNMQNRKQLYAHTNKHRQLGRQYECDICGKILKKKTTIKAHMRKQHGKKETLECETCGEQFNCVKRLKEHIFLRHENQTAVVKIPEANVTEEQVNEIVSKHFDRTCEICGFEFPVLNVTDVCQHYLTEHKKRAGGLVCCGVKMPTQTRVVDHVHWHLDSSIFKCKICNAMLGTRLSLYGHYKGHRNAENKQFRCTICNECFPRADRYKAHMTRMHSHRNPDGFAVAIVDVPTEEKEPHSNESIEIPDFFDMSCDLCSEICVSIEQARDHYLNEHNEPKGYIKCCKTKFFAVGRVKEHIEFHINPDRFKCDECGKVFKGFKLLNSHKDKHTRKFACKICDKSFSKAATLKGHLQIHAETNRERKYKCTMCEKAFYDEVGLNGHVSRVHNPGEHICEFCGKQHSTKPQLALHIRNKHSDEPVPKTKWQCNICHKWLASQGSMVTHRGKHNSDPTKCKLCDKIAPSVSALKQHMRAVHIEANLKCHLCDKSFKLASGLKDHIATHMNDRQYKCSYCEETFVWRTNMYKHQKKAHLREWSADKAKKDAAQMQP